jgi:hypothetical protein
MNFLNKLFLNGITFGIIIYTVKKAERDAGPKHEGDGKFHHPRRTIGKIRQH